ncbi:MAG: SDR family NAD(P)-dependent oxidoreductase [Pseudomonadota bacterium]
MSFAGKTAIVTGAASGMGREISRRLLAEGTKVAGIDAQKIDLPDDDAFLPLKGSVADWLFVSRAIKETYAEFGQIDYLVNAAGVLWFDRDVGVEGIDLDVWNEVLSINLTGCAHTIKAAAPHMKENGGAMVHFSTIQCVRGDDRPQDAYQASKAGLIALSKSVAIQYAADGIRSNCILPGPTQSPMQARWDDNPDGLTATQKAVPLGRVGTVADMANACTFLLSDEAGWITGTELVVDGGLLALP